MGERNREAGRPASSMSQTYRNITGVIKQGPAEFIRKSKLREKEGNSTHEFSRVHSGRWAGKKNVLIQGYVR